MACSSMSIPTSPATASKKTVLIQHDGLRRSESGKDLLNRASMRRSHSENNLCYSINSIRATLVQPKMKSSKSLGVFPFQISTSMIPNSLRSVIFNPETSKDLDLEKHGNVVDNLVGSNETHEEKEENGESNEEQEVKRANWVDRLLEIKSHWRSRQPKEDVDRNEDCVVDGIGDCNSECDEDGCLVDYDLEEEGGGGGETKYDSEMFRKFLTRVPWSDTKLFSKLAFLCNLAYVIPEIKGRDLQRYYSLRFITSSLEKKAEAAVIKARIEQDSTRMPVSTESSTEKTDQDLEQKRSTCSSVAYEIAASAASYVQSCAKGLPSCSSELWIEGDGIDSCRIQTDEDGESSPGVYKSEVAAYVAASTMTAVVAAGEKEKQEAARDLQSLHSSPCEWFVCDDLSTYTRCFVIQGSDSLASWQANLFFEPAKFEGTDVLVHRGIYEAAKGIYEQFMPEIIEHLNTYGERAKLQFTGHSLGGSLSLLVNLMLLTRKVVKPSTLRPAVTFGSPFVFCGGQKLLNDLGLDDSYIHCVMMHRDIVPRAFSCDYPNHVALVLKRLNSFRSHPCLTKNRLLYTPLGKLFILQPDEKSSPPHPLLPPGSALYAFNNTQYGFSASALKAFLNNPHPLETLSDLTAYGSEGTILRDHDSSNYLKAVNKVLRQNTKMVVRRARKQRNPLWPLLTSLSPHSWNQENNLKSNMLATKEVMTSV